MGRSDRSLLCGMRRALPAGRSVPTITTRTIRTSRPALRTASHATGRTRLWATSPWAGSSIPAVADAVDDTDSAAWGQTKARIIAPVAFEPLTYASPLEWDVQANPRGTLTITGRYRDHQSCRTPVDGGIYVLRLLQDATGGHAVTWPAGWYWSNGGDATPISSAANAVDVLTLMVIDSDICAILTQDWQT